MLIQGGGIVGSHAGDMMGEIALAIEMGADEVDIGKTIRQWLERCIFAHGWIGARCRDSGPNAFDEIRLYPSAIKGYQLLFT